MRPANRRLRLLALVAAGAVIAAPALADEALEWLGRMNAALTNRNYVGDFFHVQDGRVESLRIIHRVERGEVRERLVSLDGSGREFIRTGTELACYLPDKRTVLIERRPAGGSLLGHLPSFDENTAKYYDIRSLERARLMGRDTRVIAVSPRDQYRYGYRLWIDESTALPLKTQLCDGRGRVIEQTMFANITLPDHIPDSALLPQVATEGFRWLRHLAHAGGEDAPTAVGVWDAARLPPGFHMSARSALPMPGSSGHVAHLVFTDGLASVSVFVEDQFVPDGGNGESVSRVGSSSAFSTVVDGHQVTAVGEVPPETVRVIASSVRADATDGAASASAASPSFGVSVRGATPARSPASTAGDFGSAAPDDFPGQMPGAFNRAAPPPAPGMFPGPVPGAGPGPAAVPGAFPPAPQR